MAVNILLEASSEVKDPTEFLWRHNCIIYSIATEWKKHTRKVKRAPKDKGHMRGESKYVKEMQKLRIEIAQIAAETGRIKSNENSLPDREETDDGCLKKPKDTVQTVCTISFERPVNYLCDAWHVFRPSTKCGYILIGFELNTNARESFEHY